MAKLSKLNNRSSALDAVNAIKNSSDARLKVGGSGKEGTAWYIQGTNPKVSGTIPMSSHNAKNLPRALDDLISARDQYKLKD